MLKLSPKVMKTCSFPLALAEELREIARKLGVTELSVIIAGLRAEIARIKKERGEQDE